MVREPEANRSVPLEKRGDTSARVVPMLDNEVSIIRDDSERQLAVVASHY